MQRILTAQYL